MLFLLSAISLQAKGIVVSGTATDAATGNPAPGINAVHKNITHRVASDFDGNYSIEVPKFRIGF